jgi:UPF0271 protein
MNVLLNCDLGEGEPWAVTAALLGLVDLANIACGGHAGDEESMMRVVREALGRGVQPGAHPGWPDRGDFGRGEAVVRAEDLWQLLREQTGLLRGIVREAGGRLGHVKLHGMLYHRCNESAELAEACVDFMYAELEGCSLVCGAGGMLQAVGEARGIPLLREIFADRGYAGEGVLITRGRPGALLDDLREVEVRLRRWRETGLLPLVDGGDWLVEAETVCVHADSPGATAMAAVVREVLRGGG